MIRPKEIEQNNSMAQEIVEVLQETSLNPFSENLDKNKLYHIASGKAVSTEIEDSLLTLDEKENK